MYKTIKNLTERDVVLMQHNGALIYLSSDTLTPPPQLKRKIIKLGKVNGVDLVRSNLGEVEFLPPKEYQTLFIVSNLVAEACLDRDDLVYPGDFVKDANGKILYAKKLLSCRKLADKLLLLK